MSGSAPPLLSRHRLLRVLGLRPDASISQIDAAATRLEGILRQRLDRAGQMERARLAEELNDLDLSLRAWRDAIRPVAVAGRRDRRGLLGALIGAALTLLLLIAYAAGYRIVKIEVEGFAARFEEPARLELVGRLEGATLRVFDADREELFAKSPAQDARLELESGRYALEVSREDCPDVWTRSVFFEPGALHRFEPLLCQGEGEVTIRSNVSGDRVRIDGLDVGGTGPEAHTLGVGDHEIRIDKPGFAPFEGRVRVKPGETIELRADLAPATKASNAGAKAGEEPGGQRMRPMPVERSTPTMPPPVVGSPEPFDLEGLRAAIAPPDMRDQRSGLLQREGLPELPEGGSTAWHDRVSALLVGRYDSDGSGQIDRVEESEAISCAVWREIEKDFDSGGLGLSMARYFGFDGTEWHPNALGFARGNRSAAYEKMKECGLQP